MVRVVCGGSRDLELRTEPIGRTMCSVVVVRPIKPVLTRLKRFSYRNLSQTYILALVRYDNVPEYLDDGPFPRRASL